MSVDPEQPRSLNEMLGGAAPVPATPAPVTPDPVFGGGTTRNYGRAALKAETEKVAHAVEGTRNDTLNTSGMRLFQLAQMGELDADEVRMGLHDAAREAGLTYEETTKTLASAWRGAAAKPREPITHTATGAGVVLDLTTGELIEPATEGRTSWWPVDIEGYITGNIEPEPAPLYMTRRDGLSLFYAGKVNALIGESGSGKSWAGLLCVLDALSRGLRATYLDFEDGPGGIVERLKLMGATTEQLGRFSYVRPDEAFGPVAARDLREHVREHGPQLIVVDGVNAALGLLGLDLNDNADWYRFQAALLSPLARTGAAVVTIDHVTKSKESRGINAIGAQAKRASIDGCALIVERSTAFGRDTHGKARLTVSKDRPGHLAAHCGGGTFAGTMHVDSTQSGVTSVWVDPPDLRPAAERPAFRPTVLMERISRYLQSMGTAVSQSGVLEGVSGNQQAKRDALQILGAEGYVAVEHRGQALMFRSVKAYTQATDSLAEVL